MWYDLRKSNRNNMTNFSERSDDFIYIKFEEDELKEYLLQIKVSEKNYE
ncbi:MAG: hypothetical protein ACOCRK_03545 [bacterium]